MLKVKSLVAAALVLSGMAPGPQEPAVLPQVSFASLDCAVGWVEFPETVVTTEGIERAVDGWRLVVVPLRAENDKPGVLDLCDLDFVGVAADGARYSAVGVAWDSIFTIPPAGYWVRLTRPCPLAGAIVSAKLLFSVPTSVRSLQLFRASALGEPIALPAAPKLASRGTQKA